VGGGLAAFRKFDDFLRHLTLGLTGNLKLDLDRPQDFARLSGDRIGPVRQNVFVLQVGQRLPKDVLQATCG
jgi:hypothetical protein